MDRRRRLVFDGNQTALKSNSMRWISLSVTIVLAFVLSSEARAQLNGHNTLGDFGVLSASLPDPGFYAAGFYNRYNSDKVIDGNGDRVTFSPDMPGNITVNAFVGLLWYVSNKRILGANYSVMAVLPLANAALEVPIFGLQAETGTAFGDIYLQPVNLGWHTKRVDYTAGIGLFAPTGRYDVDADDNIGLGMWTFELFAGATVFFDEAKSWHFATTAFYETHTDKKDTEVRVGDILSLEGGLGKSFLEGALSVGVAYYAQWKISADDFGIDFELPGGPLLGKHRVFAAGPDLTVPIATKGKLIALVNARFLWEFGARTITEGKTFVVTATFPIPSIRSN